MATIAALSSGAYIQGTGLQGAPHIRENSDLQVLKLSHYFITLMTCTNSHLVSFEDFLTNVSFLHSLKFYGPNFFAGNKSRKIVEIENATNAELISVASRH